MMVSFIPVDSVKYALHRCSRECDEFSQQGVRRRAREVGLYMMLRRLRTGTIALSLVGWSRF